MEEAWPSLGPTHWRGLVHKHVTVHVDNGRNVHEQRGLVVTVDPVSASLVLLDEAELRLVLGHAVKRVQILDQDPDQDQIKRLESRLFSEPGSAVDPSLDLDLDRTRARLLDWLRLNLVPVETQGAGLAVAGGVVTVNPPFRAQDCVGTNQVVLDRVQRLVRNRDRDQALTQDLTQPQDRDQDQPEDQD